MNEPKLLPKLWEKLEDQPNPLFSLHVMAQPGLVAKKGQLFLKSSLGAYVEYTVGEGRQYNVMPLKLKTLVAYGRI